MDSDTFLTELEAHPLSIDRALAAHKALNDVTELRARVSDIRREAVIAAVNGAYSIALVAQQLGVSRSAIQRITERPALRDDE